MNDRINPYDLPAIHKAARQRRATMTTIYYPCRMAKEPQGCECYEAIASQGSACKKCEVDCYRQGWSKRDVTADNKRLVEITRRLA